MPRIQWDPKVTLGNVLTLLVMLGGIFGAFITLKLDVQAANKDIASLQQSVAPVATISTRLTVLESNQSDGKDRSLDLKDAIDELRRQNLQILTQLSAVIARLDESEKRP